MPKGERKVRSLTGGGSACGRASAKRLKVVGQLRYT